MRFFPANRFAGLSGKPAIQRAICPLKASVSKAWGAPQLIRIGSQGPGSAARRLTVLWVLRSSTTMLRRAIGLPPKGSGHQRSRAIAPALPFSYCFKCSAENCGRLKIVCMNIHFSIVGNALRTSSFLKEMRRSLPPGSFPLIGACHLKYRLLGPVSDTVYGEGGTEQPVTLCLIS